MVQDGQKSVELILFIVVKGYRRNGLGTKVFKLLLHEILTRYPTVKVIELVSNPMPREFWRKQGFKEVWIYEDNSAEMVLELNGQSSNRPVEVTSLVTKSSKQLNIRDITDIPVISKRK